MMFRFVMGLEEGSKLHWFRRSQNVHDTPPDYKKSSHVHKRNQFERRSGGAARVRQPGLSADRKIQIWIVIGENE